MEFLVLVPTLALVLRLAVAVLVLTNLAQLTDSYATDLVSDALINHVLGEGVQEVVFSTLASRARVFAGHEGDALMTRSLLPCRTRLG